MDAFYIYTENGKKLVEQIFANDVNGEATQEEIKGIILGSSLIDSSNCTVISNSDDESIIRKAFEGKFIFVIKKDSLYFVILKKDENNPVMTIEVIREIVELFKKYFKIDKLGEDTITNNYSVVVFLINEILAQGGKPNVFVDEILKNLVESDSGLLNETLKYTPVANNLCNLLALRKNISGENMSNDVNINYSYSNGTAINSRDNENVFWRANNICHLHNKICVEIMESVNCVLTKKNKIIHFAIQGNVFVHCFINGSPLIKMSFNRNIKLHLTHLHYTANYNLIRRRVHTISAGSSVSTAPELTNVLNLTNDSCTQSVLAIMDKNPQEENKQVEVQEKRDEVSQENHKRGDEVSQENHKRGDEVAQENRKREDQLSQENQKREDQVTQENRKRDDEMQNEKKEISPAEYRFKTYLEENSRPVPEEPLHRSSNNQGVKFAPALQTIPNMQQQNGNTQTSTENNRTIVIRDTLPSIENNERYLLPIKVKGVVSYIPNDYKYNIKLQLILNEIKRCSDSDMKINGYENISVKIPVYNFIRYVNIICTVGNIGYTENYNSVIWCIDRVENSDIDLSAELTLFIQPNSDGLFRSHRYYYEKFIRYNNDEYINGLPDTSQGNGISNCCYHGESARNCKTMRRSDNSSSFRSPLRIFPNRVSKWYDIDACAYPDFTFPVYVSFTVTGITASGKRVERVELKRPRNTCLHAVYRYSTCYNHVEFRI
ncbi:clathrin coat assembly protein AP50 [Plasmodium cynomolgi strain B]|uniref:Clathrin coat assembly protein AP50 n=1 Tax=Plasmodium cynomolgi (strain B) TaxID=1120755 RepID=K6UWV8_PLACD|nr:clathrin coat assembly protein AP50 [Plasmodium cynomolgi strain B]GAB68179.1 clathrin coat assembly protein AP50 [Plasmodium cynomolgi strain B]